MITIQTEFTEQPYDLALLERQVQAILTYLEYHDFDLGILLAHDATMQQYNVQYRHKDTPTDILSFPYHQDLKAGERIVVNEDDDKNLGDIILAPDYIKQDVHRWDMTFEKRMPVLLVHGICHLLGYDHIEDTDYEVMRVKEAELLRHLKEQNFS